MCKRNTAAACMGFLGMLALIFDGKTALMGASEGIRLCLYTLIPSIFPFLVLSVWLTGKLAGQPLPFLRPIGALCGIPAGTESILAIGFLGGYPVGAGNVATLHREGRLSDAQAARMIAFCNNAGPSFLFGIIEPLFSATRISWLLWSVHILSALAVGAVLPSPERSRCTPAPGPILPLTAALERSVSTMGILCGWVILMRLILAFLEKMVLRFLPVPVEIAICGILELSNGCVRLGEIECEGLRFLLAAAWLSLGGICVTLQTASVAKGISLRLYFPGKLLQCCISILLCGLCQPLFSPLHRYRVALPYLCAAAGALLCVVLVYRQKNNCGILATLGV